MNILDNLSKTKVLVVGDVILDRYWWGNVDRISPEAPVPIVRLDRTTLAAGGAANVAANIAGLGAEALLLGVVGEDIEANMLAGELEKAGVSPSHLVLAPRRPTVVKTRIIAHSQQVVRVDQEIDRTLDKEVKGILVSALRQLLPACDIVVVSDYDKGVLADDVLTEVIMQAKAAGKTVLVDPKGREYDKYRGATMITPNRREAAEACNLSEGVSGLVDMAGRRLMENLALEAVLVTQGEDGMTLFRTDREPRHFPAAARKVYDVTGAGDTVIATLATAIGAGADLETATGLANLAAGLVVEQVGTSAVTLDALRPAFEASRAAGRTTN